MIRQALNCFVAAILSAAVPASASAGGRQPAGLRVDLAGPPAIVFAAPLDGCTPDDVPDAPARAFRGADGGVTMFGLHYDNRALTGSGLGTVKIDCRIRYPSHGDADPARYDDRSWIVATFTRDGRRVDALVHHEYQANEHPGRCRFPSYMQCWFNSVVALRSEDGGESFTRAAPFVVASAPFRQDAEQGRHRGFFNPSNIFSDGTDDYFFAATTGWSGQKEGACLFRSTDADDPAAWRAFDGTAFTIRYSDPYRGKAKPAPCRPIGPFPAPVGAVVRVRPSGLWLAVFQAKHDAGVFPVSGFYVATSRDLLDWSLPRLLLAGATLYDDPCRSGGQEIAYPSILDPDAQSRNFDDAGAAPDLYYVTLSLDGCSATGRRMLLRRKLSIEPP